MIVWANTQVNFTGKKWQQRLQQELNARRPDRGPRARRLGHWEAIPEDLSDFEGYEAQETSPVLAYLLKECWDIEFPVTLRRQKEAYRGNRGRGDIMTALSASLIGSVDRGCRFVFSGYFLTSPGMPEYFTQEYEIGMGYQALERRTLADTWVPVTLKDSIEGPDGLPVLTVPDYDEVFLA